MAVSFGISIENCIQLNMIALFKLNHLMNADEWRMPVFGQNMRVLHFLLS